METWPQQLLYLNQLAASGGVMAMLPFVWWLSVAAGLLIVVVGAVLLQPRESVVVDLMRPLPPERGRRLMRVSAVVLGAVLIVVGAVHGMRSSQQYRVEAAHAVDILNDVNRKGDGQGSQALVEEKIVKLNELITLLQTMQQRTQDAEISTMLEKAEKQRNAYQRIAGSAAP